MKQSPQTDDYHYLDPKQLKQMDQVPKNRTTFQEVIVFVVGGGNYIEYQNLVDYVKVCKKDFSMKYNRLKSHDTPHCLQDLFEFAQQFRVSKQKFEILCSMNNCHKVCY